MIRSSQLLRQYRSLSSEVLLLCLRLPAARYAVLRKARMLLAMRRLSVEKRREALAETARSDSALQSVLLAPFVTRPIWSFLDREEARVAGQCVYLLAIEAVEEDV